jgi:uncharacterized membrane protein YhiD involved in acid resistance
MEASWGMRYFGIVSIVIIVSVFVFAPILLAQENENKKSSNKLLMSDEEDLLLKSGMGFKTMVEVFKRVGFAALLGTVIALHPLRLRRRQTAVDPLRVALAIRAQILICTAGALMVVVIAGSLARAFGLVGLGSFVRFRTTIKDPTDTAVLFLLVGIGMACGLAAYAIALFGTLTVFCVLALLELKTISDIRVISLEMKAPEDVLNKALKHLREKENIRVQKFSLKLKKESATVNISVSPTMNVESLLAEMRSLGEFSELGFEEIKE